MILIADSGSTKTDWVIVTSTAQPVVINTQGINPVHQSREQIVSIIRDEFQNRVGAEAVYFYGSGIRPEMEKTMRDILEEMFPQAMTVEVHSDLLGAARALCGHEYGIASILGTGANSCLYDGEKIVEHTPALGYILGDEGSGAALGKRFLHDLYGGKLSEEIKTTFEKDMHLDLAEIINRVYRQPLANRFLASLSVFISNHREDEGVHGVLVNNFVDFLNYHIAPYNRRDLPVSFIGSIAWHYQEELLEAAQQAGFFVGTILKSPLGGLLRYHKI